jgi:hypothetical protein
MFKRIHSNRDPNSTLWKELHREFRKYFEKTGRNFGKICVSYPRVLFGLMILLLFSSAILSFTIFRRPATRVKSKVVLAKQPVRTIDDGFSQIMSTGIALKHTLDLKKNVEAILAKGRLNHTDSVTLESTLDSLQHLQYQNQH